MDAHSAELNHLSKEEISQFERTRIHTVATMSWLRSRHVSKAKLRYIFFPEDLYKHWEINELFRGFDADGSDGIELNELVSMFKDNGIYLSRDEIETIFNLVDANGDRTLNLSEFKKSVFSDYVNTAFAHLMRNFKINKSAEAQELQRKLKEEEDAAFFASTPGYVSIMQSQNRILEEQTSNQSDNKQNNSNNHSNARSIENKRKGNESPSIEQVKRQQSQSQISESNNNNTPQVIPMTFASMVEFFSYNFQRSEQIKKVDSMPSTAVQTKVAELKSLMQLSSKFTEQSKHKIDTLTRKYKYQSFADKQYPEEEESKQHGKSTENQKANNNSQVHESQNEQNISNNVNIVAQHKQAKDLTQLNTEIPLSKPSLLVQNEKRYNQMSHEEVEENEETERKSDGQCVDEMINNKIERGENRMNITPILPRNIATMMTTQMTSTTDRSLERFRITARSEQLQLSSSRSQQQQQQQQHRKTAVKQFGVTSSSNMSAGIGGATATSEGFHNRGVQGTNQIRGSSSDNYRYGSTQQQQQVNNPATSSSNFLQRTQQSFFSKTAQSSSQVSVSSSAAVKLTSWMTNGILLNPEFLPSAKSRRGSTGSSNNNLFLKNSFLKRDDEFLRRTLKKMDLGIAQKEHAFASTARTGMTQIPVAAAAAATASSLTSSSSMSPLKAFSRHARVATMPSLDILKQTASKENEQNNISCNKDDQTIECQIQEGGKQEDEKAFITLQPAKTNSFDEHLQSNNNNKNNKKLVQSPVKQQTQATEQSQKSEEKESNGSAVFFEKKWGNFHMRNMYQQQQLIGNASERSKLGISTWTIPSNAVLAISPEVKRVSNNKTRSTQKLRQSTTAATIGGVVEPSQSMLTIQSSMHNPFNNINNNNSMILVSNNNNNMHNSNSSYSSNIANQEQLLMDSSQNINNSLNRNNGSQKLVQLRMVHQKSLSMSSQQSLQSMMHRQQMKTSTESTSNMNYTRKESIDSPVVNVGGTAPEMIKGNDREPTKLRLLVSIPKSESQSRLSAPTTAASNMSTSANEFFNRRKFSSATNKYLSQNSQQSINNIMSGASSFSAIPEITGSSGGGAQSNGGSAGNHVINVQSNMGSNNNYQKSELTLSPLKITSFKSFQPIPSSDK